ncbi:selenoprotein O, partial [Escherichia coli]|nr:selenoprotein O [Escherichia coli]
NINVTGESFDYGPWRFAPFWDPGFTAAYFDHAGLYAFGRQPEAIYWDAMQLAIALRRIADEEALIEAMETFPEVYRREVAEALLWRLGVTPRSTEADRVLASTLEKALAETLT